MSPVAQINDVHSTIDVSNSCNSKCCNWLPRSPKPKRNKTDEKVKKSRCTLI